MAMAEVRDKGEIPLARPDSKPFGGIDPQTGYLWSGYIDLAAHKAVIWWEPRGWLPVVDYPNVYLVGWVGFTHNSHFKLEGRTWDESPGGAAVPGKHFIIIDFGPIPR